MATDEEIVRAYEGEFAPEPRRRSNRGFWTVLGVTLAASAFVLVEIFAHRPLGNAIGLAQESLIRSQRAAVRLRSETDGFAAADADALAGAVAGLSFRGEDEPSEGVRDVSVSASEDVWSAAVQARPEACFYVRLEVGEDPRYGAGEGCTGEAALSADQPRW